MPGSRPPLNFDWIPFDPEHHRRQLVGLMNLLPADRAATILDLGCGSGRTLLPLATLGHHCLGIDNDPAALDACRAALDEAPDDTQLKLLHFNFNTKSTSQNEIDQYWPREIIDRAPFDLITCLGNTWMLVHDPAPATTLLRNIIAILSPEHGRFAIDNLPADLWPCLTSGDWQSGVSDDRESQIVWSPDDNVFALREGAENVDLYYDESFKKDDRLHRLWTTGELRLLAAAANVPDPHIDEESHLITFQPSPKKESR